MYQQSSKKFTHDDDSEIQELVKENFYGSILHFTHQKLNSGFASDRNSKEKIKPKLPIKISIDSHSIENFDEEKFEKIPKKKEKKNKNPFDNLFKIKTALEMKIKSKDGFGKGNRLKTLIQKNFKKLKKMKSMEILKKPVNENFEEINYEEFNVEQTRGDYLWNELLLRLGKISRDEMFQMRKDKENFYELEKERLRVL